MKTLLAVDLGGTKSHLGLFALDKWTGVAFVQEVFKNIHYSGIEEIIDLFLSKTSFSVDCACLAVAGVVGDSHAVMTNLSWQVRVEALTSRFFFKHVFLLNDLAALASAIPLLRDNDSFEIQRGKKEKEQTIAILAPGTGLGQGYLLKSGKDYIARGSEGGHSGFAPTNIEEIELLQWMMKKHRVVSVEDVCSGPAIAHLFDFCKEKSGMLPAEWIQEKLENTQDITHVIVAGATAIENSCPLCCRTIEMFLSLLGSEAGNLVLKLYARGGLYIGGGVMMPLLGRVSFKPFLDNFKNKGKMASLMAEIPVYVIKKKDAPLCGAAAYGRNICLKQL